MDYVLTDKKSERIISKIFDTKAIRENKLSHKSLALKLHLSRFLVTFTLCFSTVSISAQAEIKNISSTIDNDLIVTTTYDDKIPVKAAVLMIPGWTAPIDSVGDLYKALAFDLARLGIASLRTNIRGESERELTNYTLTNTYAERVRDATLAYEKLIKLYPEVNIGILGHSLGASTTLSLLAKTGNEVSSVSLWSMAGNPNDLFTSRVLNEKEQQEVLLEGQVTISRWADITITRRHFLGMTSEDLYAPLKSYSNPLMHIVGSDEDRHPEMDLLFSSTESDIKEDITIVGADHIYNVFDESKPYSKQVRSRTKQWFADTLLGFQ